MATEISGVKRPLYEEDVQFGTGLSEQVFTKYAENIMHIHNNQFMKWDFRFLGPLRAIAGGGEDGSFVPIQDFEICGFSWSFKTAPTSNDFLILDIHEIDSSGNDQGSILDRRLTIRGSETDGHTGYYVNFINNTGTTYTIPSENPTFTNDAARLFTAGTALRVDLDTADEGFENFCFNIFYRPQ